MNDEFVKLVRKGKIPAPTVRSYSKAKWEKAFKSIKTPSDRDTSLYESGLLLSEKLQEVRDKLSHLHLDEIDPSVLRLYICGGINREMSNLSYYSLESHKTSDDKQPVVWLQDLIYGVAEGDEDLRLNPSGMQEILIDGSKFPISQSTPTGKHPQRLPELPDDLDKRCTDSIVLGQFYYLYTQQLDRCIWNDWTTTRSDDGLLLFHPLDQDHDGRIEVAHHRRTELAFSEMISFRHNWKRDLSREQRAQLTRGRGQIALRPERHLVRCKLTPSNVSIDNPPNILIDLILIDNEEYLLHIIDQPLDILDCCAPREVIHKLWEPNSPSRAGDSHEEASYDRRDYHAVAEDRAHAC